MVAAPRFSIRQALLLTTLVAICTLPLTAPSKWWMFIFPAVACLLSVFVISRLPISPIRGQMFWIGLLIGAFVYLASVAFVGKMSSQRYRERDVWGEEFAEPLWEHIHGRSVFQTNTQQLSMSDYISFFIYVHILSALLISTPAAGVAQFLAYRRESGAVDQLRS